jgi:F-type H+-transporting ATPase subunit delta
MAEPSTIARPYAEAAFKLADGADKLADWSAALANLAAVAADERMRAVAGDPNLPAEKVAGLFISVLAGRLPADGENFVRVLAENGRLDVIEEIRAQYEALKNEREGVVEAEVVSAFEMDRAQLADLVARLEKRTGRRNRSSPNAWLRPVGPRVPRDRPTPSSEQAPYHSRCPATLHSAPSVRPRLYERSRH